MENWIGIVIGVVVVIALALVVGPMIIDWVVAQVEGWDFNI